MGLRESKMPFYRARMIVSDEIKSRTKLMQVAKKTDTLRRKPLQYECRRDNVCNRVHSLIPCTGSFSSLNYERAHTRKRQPRWSNFLARTLTGFNMVSEFSPGTFVAMSSRFMKLVDPQIGPVVKFLLISRRHLGSLWSEPTYGNGLFGSSSPRQICIYR